MGTANTFGSDLYALYKLVQNTMLVHPKELFIEILREEFNNDSFYHYVRDEWGFPKTPDHTDLEPEAGINDDVTSRLFIGEPYRYDVDFYPAILVRTGGSRYVPISMNRERGSVQYATTRFIDGYGNESFVSTPSHFIHAGAWEGTINIDVHTRDPRSRDDLVQLVSIIFTDIRFEDMLTSGVFIKTTSVSAPSETDDGNNKIFKQTISFDIRTEWRRHIPVLSTVDVINFCIDFGNLETTPPDIAPNMRIVTSFELIDALSDL